MDKLRVAVDCAVTAWFLMGNMWVYEGRPSTNECSTNVRRFVVMVVTLCCMSCAMPLVLCTALCCCVPGVVRVLGLELLMLEGADADEEDDDGGYYGGCPKGASDEAIAALPTLAFSPSSPTTACCICLLNYTHGSSLRELPCSHKFHMGCVDQWLKISGSCPLCKQRITTAPRLNPTHSEDGDQERLLRCF